MAKHKIHLIDTNILDCLFEVKGKSSGCGKKEIERKIKNITKNGEYILLPLPMLIECGNHIGYAKDVKASEKLINYFQKSLNTESPWLDFDTQNKFWDKNKLKEAMKYWDKKFVKEGIGLGDFFLILVKNYYKAIHPDWEIEIWSNDGGVTKKLISFSFQEHKKLQEIFAPKKTRNRRKRN